MIRWILLTALAPPAIFDDGGHDYKNVHQPLKIDLLLKPPAEKCDTQPTDEIVVCAKRADNESQRLKPIAKADIYDKDESAAEFGIAQNIRMAAEVVRE